MKKILLVFGTRPEAIKMAPLVKALKSRPEQFQTRVCVTGQHREMLHQVLDIFHIIPDYDLDIMQPGQDLYDITARVLVGMRQVLEASSPDVVLVHGDTTTSTAAALAAFYKQIPVGHVEAGLRTHDIYSPWPEEMNRQLTGRIATLHFAPTPLGRQNLLDEGTPENRIFVTGNTVIDALHSALETIDGNASLRASLLESVGQAGYSVDRLSAGRKLILITGHRRENFGAGFQAICQAIKELSLKYPDFDFVYPMHLNPHVREAVHSVFGSRQDSGSNLFFIEPLQYFEFLCLMRNAYLVLTDSGGIQEEAPGLSIPVLVMRDTTERPEAVEAGTVKLVGANKELIVKEASTLIECPAAYEKMQRTVNPYGDGHACERILSVLESL